MMSQSTLLNAFWKSTNTEYSGVCCSSDCLMMICSVAIWSVQDLSWRKPACSSCRVSSRAFLSLSRMILARGGGRGYSIYPWVGMCGAAPHTLTLFKTNIADFPTLFKTEFRFFNTLFKTFNPNIN